MNKKLIISLVMVGIMAFGAGLGSYAWFTSAATSNDNVFQAGTLQLDVNNDVEGAYTLELGEISNIQPGDVMNEEEIVITNEGTLDLAWFGNFVINPGDEKLAEAIYIKEMQMEFLDDNGGADWEPVDRFISNGVGAGTYAAHYNTLVDNEMGVITLKNFLADNAMGAGPGVQMGALKPNYSYRLTFTLGMAEEADNEYQGLGMGLKYVVDATQVNAGALDDLITNGHNHLTWLNAQLDKQN